MFSLASKMVATAATGAAVRLPQPSTSSAVALPTGWAGKPAPTVLPGSGVKHASYRAERARYQAQCRRAMAF
ncbi:MAG: hypothetical protein EOO62_23250 [Hymenobacter sp.]|nr:MAG: hypothetical protein EOO62_23250 [Hymenobacter sp.]